MTTTAARAIIWATCAVAVVVGFMLGHMLVAGWLLVAVLPLLAWATWRDLSHVCDPPVEDAPPGQPWICPGCDRGYVHAGDGVWKDQP